VGRQHHDSSVYDLALANINDVTETGFENGTVYVFDIDVEAVACGWLKYSFHSLIMQMNLLLYGVAIQYYY
jgi:hypothetical protein